MADDVVVVVGHTLDKIMVVNVVDRLVDELLPRAFAITNVFPQVLQDQALSRGRYMVPRIS